jgi:hypothetical protein
VALDSFLKSLADLRPRRATPPVKAPARPRLRPLRASRAGSWWTARAAVRAGAPLDAFLRHRLSEHLARLPIPSARLPIAFSVDDAGDVATAPSESTPRPPWLEAYLRAEGSTAVSAEIQLGHADAAQLAARIDAHRQRVAELTRDVEGATRGASIADPEDDAQAQWAGRPPVPAPLGVALQVVAAILVVAQAWQLALPFLALAGLPPRQLAAELQRDPLRIALGALFTLGASTSLFVAAHLARRRVAGWFALDAAHGRRAPAVLAIATIATIAAVSGSIALRGAGPSLDAVYAPGALFLALLVVPFTGGWLFELGRRMERARAEATALARAWDADHYRVLRDLGRRTAALAEEEQRLTSLESRRSAILQRTRALQQRAATAERLAADAAAEEHQELARMAQAVGTALERDRYHYVRLACSRGLVARPDPLPAGPVPPALRGARDVPESTKLGLAS